MVSSPSLDYETTASYTLTIAVSDGTSVVSGTLTVVVTDVNEGPVLQNLPAGVSMSEGSTGQVMLVSAYDDDGDTLTYSVAMDVPVTGTNPFIISSTGRSCWQVVLNRNTIK